VASAGVGTYELRPLAESPTILADITAAGLDGQVTYGGATIASGLREPRQAIVPIATGMECIPIVGGNLNDPPTLLSQSFFVRIERLVFEGPPGLTFADILR
jgi:hypothetical protein